MTIAIITQNQERVAVSVLRVIGDGRQKQTLAALLPFSLIAACSS